MASMEEFVPQIDEIVEKLSQGLVPSTWQDKMSAVKQQISEMILEVMTNKPYATNYSEEDEKKLTDLEAELAALIASFRDCLDQEPWVYPAMMKKLREAGDSMSSKVKELHKW